MKVRVPASKKPFWLVLGESHNAGWTASANGKDLGAPQLVDGYANGWLVKPNGSAPTTISVVWTPQRTVSIAFLISLLAALACVGIVITAFVRAPATRLRVPRSAGSNGEVPVEIGLRVSSLRTLFEPSPARLSTRASWITVGSIVVASAVLVRPWAGLLVGALAALAIMRPRWRWLLRLGPAAIVGAITLYMAVGQYVRQYPPRFDWPTFYSAARAPAWIAVMLLAADALIEVVSRATRSRARSALPPLEEPVESEVQRESATP